MRVRTMRVRTMREGERFWKESEKESKRERESKKILKYSKERETNAP